MKNLHSRTPRKSSVVIATLTIYVILFLQSRKPNSSRKSCSGCSRPGASTFLNGQRCYERSRRPRTHSLRRGKLRVKAPLARRGRSYRQLDLWPCRAGTVVCSRQPQRHVTTIPTLT
ncbi:unnamed protein product, partial [Trichogramma brassicae]